MSKGPVLIDLDETEEGPSPAEAPPVPDPLLSAPKGAAMQSVATLAARKPSRLARWFWSALLALVGALVSVAAWDYVTGLLASRPLLGAIIAAMIGLVLLLLLVICLREMAAFGRLSRIDRFQREADEALASGNLEAARALSSDLIRFYKGREETRWGREAMGERMGDLFDADAVLALADHELVRPLDKAAQREVEAAARQVATVTALVPLALADVVAALTANLRMIRRIAEIYGGRSGALGSWRLTRAVMAHLVATGAVAVGDDMLEPLLGGSLLGKLSRRFGEGMVNGALTARVGVAAMEVCRPLPFAEGKRPRVRSIVQSALTGLVSRER
ncbi:YcjF family protein [Primorskyibacter sp. S187A]|uniref:YcjF family protein n=1 Tax=Primorskyibacter sp. S187A TaxID=3415130 RepID=UPI003C7D8724